MGRPKLPLTPEEMKARVREQKRATKIKNREKTNAKERAERAANPEKFKALDKKRRERDRENINQRAKEWARNRQKDPEFAKKMAEKARIYREKNPETNRASWKASAKKNIEKIKAKSKALYWSDPTIREAMAERHRIYYQNTRDERMAACARYVKKNRDKVRTVDRNYRARRKMAEGSHSAEDTVALFNKQQGICTGCMERLPGNFHVDHIHPLSRGGSNWPDNLQLLCKSCNSSKHDLLPDEWEKRKAKRGGSKSIQT